MKNLIFLIYFGKISLIYMFFLKKNALTTENEGGIMGQEKIVIGDKSFIVGGFYERQIGDSPIKSFCKIIAKIDNADDLLVYGMRDPYDPQKSLSPRFDVCIIPVGDVGQELSEIDIKDILGLFAVQAKQCVDSSMAEALNKLIDFPSQS